MSGMRAASASRARCWSAAGLASCLVLSGASLCWAADSAPESSAPGSSERALALGKLGATAYEAGDHGAAIEHFDRAFALLPAPSLQLWAARACAQLGRLVEAQRRYREAASLSDQIGDRAVQREAQLQARRELEQLSERIPLLAVEVTGTAGQPARLTLDDQPFEPAPGQHAPLDPGQHVLLGSYQGQRVSLPFELAAGERRELVVAFSPASASSPAASFSPASTAPEGPPAMAPASSAKAWRTAAWMGIGTGGALLLTGIITRSVAQGRYDDLQREPGCSRDRCTPSLRDSVERYESMRSASLVTTIGGAALAAAGAGVLLFVPADAEAGSLALWPGGVAWTRRF